jgi:hypothetical protein
LVLLSISPEPQIISAGCGKSGPRIRRVNKTCSASQNADVNESQLAFYVDGPSRLFNVVADFKGKPRDA